MDTKQAADSIAYLTARIDDISDMHGSDFMYFSQWLRELDTKVKNLDAVVLKFEKTQRFAEATKAAAPQVIHVQSVSKFKIALAIGVGVAAGIKMNEYMTGVLYNKPKKEQ